MNNNTFVELERIVKELSTISSEIQSGWIDNIGTKISTYFSMEASKLNKKCENSAYCLKQMSDCEKLCNEILKPNDGDGKILILSRQK